MRRRWVFIAAVLVASVAAVGVETVAMAVWGELRLSIGAEQPPWPRAVDKGWPAVPTGRSTSRTAFLDADRFMATEGQQSGDIHAQFDRLFDLSMVRVGWPMRCSECETAQAGKLVSYRRYAWVVEEPHTAWQHGLEVPNWLKRPTTASSDEYFRRIPIRPIWPGFAVNVLLNACVIGPLMLVPGWMVRARRRRKEACPACGYALAGLGAGARCPECGKAE